MNSTLFVALALGLTTPTFLADQKATKAPQTSAAINNPRIDYQAYARLAEEIGEYREKRLITEEQFLEMAENEETIILDTRSARAFTLKHVKGAVHVNFSDITEGALAAAIPSRKTRILIYCNNNFENDELAFAMKSAPAALNLPTFQTLYTYGYRNVYELGELLDVNETKIPLAEGAPPERKAKSAKGAPRSK